MSAEMRRRTLPGTELSVSELSLGTVELGLDYGIPSERTRQPSIEEAERLLHGALDLGINHIDTARIYGESEEIIGATLASRRNEFFLTTKVAVPDNPEATAGEFFDAFAGSVDTSLRLLRTAVVDVLMLHSASLETICRGRAAEALVRLRERGFCRFTGASVYGNAAALAAIQSGAFQCLQVAHSILDRRPESEVFPEAARAGVGIIARSVLLKGALTWRYRDLPDRLDALRRAVASLEAGIDLLPQLAYRYVLSQTPPHSVLVGPSNLAELEEVVGFPDCPRMSDSELSFYRSQPTLSESMLNPACWAI
jgi:hypothetical protein